MSITVSSPRTLLAAALLPGLAACAGTDAPVEEAVATTPEGDVLAPEVYALSGEALWSGAPSLGGVWVAHPEVDEPALARISRADGDARSVTGALFRREASDGGPAILASAEAARALGMAPGEAVPLEVVALRRPGAEAPSPEPDPEP